MRYESKTGTVPPFGENRSKREYTHENRDYEKKSAIFLIVLFNSEIGTYSSHRRIVDHFEDTILLQG